MIPTRVTDRLRPEGAHLLWCGSLTAGGYGQVMVDGRFWYVHRLVWVDAHGPIPEGFEIHHTCKVKRCAAIAHLVLTSRADHPDSAPTVNRTKTHCKRGHEYTPANTIWRKDGSRICRECRKVRGN